MSKGKATRRVSIDYDVDDIGNALMNVMPDFWNKERLSRFIANSMMDLGSTHCTELIKRINGAQPELEFVVGMNMYVSEYGISSWRMSKDNTVKAGYAKHAEDSDRILVKCKILDIDPDSIKPYYISYTVADDLGNTSTNDVYVSSDMLEPLINL